MFRKAKQKKKTTAKTTNNLKLSQVGTVLGHLTLFAPVSLQFVYMYLCIFVSLLCIFLSLL